MIASPRYGSGAPNLLARPRICRRPLKLKVALAGRYSLPRAAAVFEVHEFGIIFRLHAMMEPEM